MTDEFHSSSAQDFAMDIEPTITMADDRIVGPHMEIANPRVGVDIMVADNRVWVNVDGICRMRISAAHEIEVQVDGKKVPRR